MPYKQVLQYTHDCIPKAFEHLEPTFAGVRTGMASSSLVEDIRAEYYGTHTILRQITGITPVNDGRVARMVATIQPDHPEKMAAIQHLFAGHVHIEALLRAACGAAPISRSQSTQ